MHIFGFKRIALAFDVLTFLWSVYYRRPPRAMAVRAF